MHQVMILAASNGHIAIYMRNLLMKVYFHQFVVVNWWFKSINSFTGGIAIFSLNKCRKNSLFWGIKNREHIIGAEGLEKSALFR